MKTIFITISRGSLIRNFFRTNIVQDLLLAGHKVVVLTPYFDNKELFKEFEHENLFFEPLHRPTSLKFQKILSEYFEGVVFNRTVHFLYTRRLSGSFIPRKSLYIPRMLFVVPFTYVPGFKRFLRYIDIKINPQKEHDYLFEKYQPDLVFTTSATSLPDVGVQKSAKRLGVMSVCMPKSWDNLNKELIRTKSDHIIVWNKYMKEEALKYQDYKEHEVTIIGVPQFDYYRRTDVLLSREKYCETLGLDPQKKILLYASTGGNCCDESVYVELIRKTMEEGRLKNVQVVMRPHLGYIGDEKQFLSCAESENFVLDRSDKQDANLSDHWDPSEHHLRHLTNSLHHADVVINIASTITLDAIACGSPVINIKFDVHNNLGPHDTALRLFKSEYIRAIERSKGSWIVKSSEEFIEVLNDISAGSKKETAQIKEFERYFLHKLDGKSSKRLSDTLLRIMDTKHEG